MEGKLKWRINPVCISASSGNFLKLMAKNKKGINARERRWLDGRSSPF